MPLPQPDFQKVLYREILNEAVRRIPVHNPEWTNFSDSDPGMTLLQLFAFMTESLGYRSNRIPERNRQKFLHLLGVELMPAQAASGFVQFSNPNGALVVHTIDADQEVRSGKTPFRTTNGLDVLPVEAALFYKQRLSGEEKDDAQRVYEQLYASLAEPGKSLEFYETREFSPTASGTLLPTLDASDSVDGLWLALFTRRGDAVAETREKIAGKTLTLGIVPALDESGIRHHPEGVLREDSSTSLVFETPLVADTGNEARYRQLPATASANPLIEPSIVQLTLGTAEELGYWDNLEPLESGTGAYPPNLDDDERVDRLVTWVHIRLPRSSEADSRVRFRVSWVGINAATIVQRARVNSELLPGGTGQADQTARLANTPVLVDTVRVTVNGQLWQRIDDLNAAAPEVPVSGPRLAAQADAAPTATPLDAGAAQVYTIDRESGEIRFGDGAHGARPPRGAVILASYDYGGGRSGLVGIGTIKTSASAGDLKVTNPVPTWGGDEGETTADAEQRVPAFLKHRDRLVTREDFDAIARRTPGVDIGRIEVQPLYHPEQPNQSSVGVVTLMVIPAFDSRYPETPVPDALFLRTLCRFLTPRRLVTTELHVRGPEYVNIYVSVAVEVQPGRDQGPVRKAVQDRLIAFFSALRGGFGETGWPLLKAVDIGEISAAAARVDGVAKVTELLLGDAAGARTAPLPMTGLQLPRLTGISVVSNSVSAQPIDELKGDVPPVSTEAFTPVPVVPEHC